MITLQTKCGPIIGKQESECNIFRGVPYAKAQRFSYAQAVTSWGGTLEALKDGPSCPQYRTYFPHLENPCLYFYHKELRENIEFSYDEDCLNCNIFTPSKKGKYPVIIFIHGGSFNSNSNNEDPFKGIEFAKRGIVTVFINYRVGVLGFISHKEIYDTFGRDGNLGLDDQFTAIKWVKANIGDFYGDSENITLMGQSAGAMSIQYLCCSPLCKGLFKNAVMMSGGGKFPDFSLPKKACDAHSYWLDFMKMSGISTFEELKKMDLKELFTCLDKFTPLRDDNIFNTMPVIDGYLIPKSIKELIKNPLKVNYMLSYTNSDMYAPLLAYVSHSFVRKNGGYLYFFDINPKGSKIKAFHSADLRYMFNTLESSWRPYEAEDKEIADLLEDYIANFARCGNPNGLEKNPDLPYWKKSGHRALRLCLRKNKKEKKHFQCKMKRPPYLRLLWNYLTEIKLV